MSLSGQLVSYAALLHPSSHASSPPLLPGHKFLRHTACMFVDFARLEAAIEVRSCLQAGSVHVTGASHSPKSWPHQPHLHHPQTALTELAPVFSCLTELALFLPGKLTAGPRPPGRLPCGRRLPAGGIQERKPALGPRQVADLAIAVCSTGGAWDGHSCIVTEC